MMPTRWSTLWIVMIVVNCIWLQVKACLFLPEHCKLDLPGLHAVELAYGERCIVHPFAKTVHKSVDLSHTLTYAQPYCLCMFSQVELLVPWLFVHVTTDLWDLAADTIIMCYEHLDLEWACSVIIKWSWHPQEFTLGPWYTAADFRIFSALNHQCLTTSMLVVQSVLCTWVRFSDRDSTGCLDLTRCVVIVCGWWFYLLVETGQIFLVWPIFSVGPWIRQLWSQCPILEKAEPSPYRHINFTTVTQHKSSHKLYFHPFSLAVCSIFFRPGPSPNWIELPCNL